MQIAVIDAVGDVLTEPDCLIAKALDTVVVNADAVTGGGRYAHGQQAINAKAPQCVREGLVASASAVSEHELGEGITVFPNDGLTLPVGAVAGEVGAHVLLP
jgi:hypothetical protein